jgi:hypothetical protein
MFMMESLALGEEAVETGVLREQQASVQKGHTLSFRTGKSVWWVYGPFLVTLE